ncbi:MAG: adhesion factor FAF [Finegoldia magna]|uniref:adhesion factor FAF n=1 Tax=Finegoldia magna TaxID=1260 RepID=UPI002914F8EE|nr:adhesion factor FAF [Finegoldia magna]MDU5223664.1 adhesion factor FAF [Finegoldia magna]
MKLNKKLLTAALAGALIVTAVPAGTFAEEAKPNTDTRLYKNKEQAAKELDRLAKRIKELSDRRAEIVTRAWKMNATSEGLIEKLQREEAAAKKAYEAAKANYEAATKAWEDAKDAQEKARLAKIAAEDAADAKLGEYHKLLQKAKDARKAAEEEAYRQYDTTIANMQRKFETATTRVDAAKNAVKAAQEAYDTAIATQKDEKGEIGKANDGHITELRLVLEKAQAELDAAKNAAISASNERADVSKSAEKTRDAALKQAADNYTAEKQRLDFIYKLNDNYGESAAELTKLERAKINAINAYNAAIENTKAAHDAYIAARDNFDAKAKAYAHANQKAYKITEELKNIEKQLKEAYVDINVILKDQNKNINSLADQLSADLIKEIKNFGELTQSEQAGVIAKLQEELAKLKREYNKTSEGIQEVKKLVTYQFHVKDTEGAGVQGLTLKLTNVDDTSKVYTATSDANGLIQFKSMVEGKYSVTVTKVPTGYDVYQDGKKIDSVKALFRAESEVKAENNAEEATAKKDEAKGNKRVDIPSIIDNTTGPKEDKKEDEKIIDGGTIIVDKKEKDNKDEKDNKKPEKEDNKKPEKEDKKNNKKLTKPAKPDMPKKKLPKAGAAAEAATIAAAAMATMGGAYLSLKKRK